jgi:hypothetical protein
MTVRLSLQANQVALGVKTEVKAEISKKQIGVGLRVFSDFPPALGASVDSQITSTKKATSLTGCRLFIYRR